MSDDAPRRIGQVAKLLGISTRTVRYYEEVGLLGPQNTTDGGFRLYADADVERLTRIIHLKEVLNFTLDEVRYVMESDDELESLKEKGRADEDAGIRLEVIDSILALLDHQRDLALHQQIQLKTFLEDLGTKTAKAQEHRARYTALLRGEASLPVGDGARRVAPKARGNTQSEQEPDSPRVVAEPASRGRTARGSG